MARSLPLDWLIAQHRHALALALLTWSSTGGWHGAQGKERGSAAAPSQPAACDYLLVHHGDSADGVQAARRIIEAEHRGALTLCSLTVSDHTGQGAAFHSCEKLSKQSTYCEMTTGSGETRIDQINRRLTSGLSHREAAAGVEAHDSISVGFKKAILFPRFAQYVLRKDMVDPFAIDRIWLVSGSASASDVTGRLLAQLSTPMRTTCTVGIVGSDWNSLHALCQLRSQSTDALPTRSLLLCPDPSPLSDTLPKYLCDVLGRRVKAAGCEVRAFTAVHYVAAGNTSGLEVHACRTYDALSTSTLLLDALILAPTSMPGDTRLAEGAGTGAGALLRDNSHPRARGASPLNAIEVDESHGCISVNSDLASSSHVYVAGCGMSYPDPLYGRVRALCTPDNEVRSAQTAARNAVATHPGSDAPHLSPTPYSCVPIERHSLPPLGLHTMTVGRVSARQESIGYWVRGAGIGNKRAGSAGVAIPGASGGQTFDLGCVFYLQPQEGALDPALGLRQVRYSITGVLLWGVGEQGSVPSTAMQGDLQEAALLCTRLVQSSMQSPIAPAPASYGDPQASRDALMHLLALPARTVLGTLGLRGKPDGAGIHSSTSSSPVPALALLGGPAPGASGEPGPGAEGERDGDGQQVHHPANELLADPFAAYKAARAEALRGNRHGSLQLQPLWCPARQPPPHTSAGAVRYGLLAGTASTSSGGAAGSSSGVAPKSWAWGTTSLR